VYLFINSNKFIFYIDGIEEIRHRILLAIIDMDAPYGAIRSLFKPAIIEHEAYCILLVNLI